LGIEVAQNESDLGICGAMVQLFDHSWNKYIQQFWLPIPDMMQNPASSSAFSFRTAKG